MKMTDRSAISRADIIEFQEATEDEAYAYLIDRVGKANFHEKKDELVKLVQNYTGGKYSALDTVVKSIDDLKGLCDCCFIVLFINSVF